jgi:hypothetical protein
MTTRTNLAAHVLIVAALFLFPLIMFWQVTIGDRTLIPADNLYQYQPWKAYREQVGVPEIPHNSLLSDLVLQNFQWKTFIREAISAGEIPLWNPYIFAGVPFLAAGQHSALYPFSVIYYVMPLEKAYGWFTVSQLWLAGVMMFVFMRGLGVGRMGALAAGIAYQLAGCFLASVVFPMIIAAAAWFPFLLLMVEFTIQQRPLFGKRTVIPWVALGALGLGMEILAGHVEFTYYALLMMGFWSALRLGWMLVKNLTPTPSAQTERGFKNGFVPLVRPAVGLIALVVLGLGVGAVQFVPLFELANRNFRQGSATLDEVRAWAYPPRHAFAFFLPNVFGSPAQHDYTDVFTGQQTPIRWNPDPNNPGYVKTDTFFGIKNYVEGASYLGLLTMLLALIGFVSGLDPRLRNDKPYRAILAIMAVLSLTFVFGTLTYAILYYGLPGINQLHSPFRWIYPLTLCVAALAGFGMDALLRTSRPTETHPHTLTWTFVGALRWHVTLTAILVLAALFVSRVFFEPLRGIITRIYEGLAGANTAFPTVEAFYSFQFQQVLIFGIVLLGCAVVLHLSRSKWHVRGVPITGWWRAA